MEKPGSQVRVPAPLVLKLPDMKESTQFLLLPTNLSQAKPSPEDPFVSVGNLPIGPPVRYLLTILSSPSRDIKLIFMTLQGLM